MKSALIQNLCRSAAISLTAALSALGFAQDKGIYLVNETKGNVRSGEIVRWLIGNNGTFGGETLYEFHWMFVPGWVCRGASDSLSPNTVASIWQNEVGELMWVFKTKTRIVGAIAVQNFLPTGSNVVATRDFNGDGIADLLVQAANANLEVWVMGGIGEVRTRVIPLGSPVISGSDRFAGFADVDGDGLSDVILQRTRKDLVYWKGTGSDVVRLANGNPERKELAELRKNVAEYKNFFVIGAMDINGDGSNELVCRFLHDSGKYAVWILNNDGTNRFPIEMQTQFRNAGFKTPLGAGKNF